MGPLSAVKRGVVALAAAGLVSSACLADDLDPNAAFVDGDGSVVLTMDEFSYQPRSITVDAGATIELVVVNEGAVEHELMIGSSALDNGGYSEDLLADMMTPSDAEGIAETVFAQSDEPTAEPEDPDCVVPEPDHDDGATADHSHDPPDLPAHCEADEHGTDSADHNESGDHHDDADQDADVADHQDDMGDHHDDADQDADVADHQDDMGDHHEDSDDHHGSDGGHSGAHITVPAGGTQTIRLTIPLDAVGEWEMGCFLPDHYEAGMTGVFIVRPGSA